MELSDIGILTHEAYKNAVEKGLLDGLDDPADLKKATVNKLEEEVIEFWNSSPMFGFTKDSEQSEIADIIIVLMTYSKAMGYDLEEAIVEKMNFNSTRPYKHEEKKNA